jgi:CRP/FNR family transcriptional regulator
VKVVRENGNGNEYFMHYLEGGEACALTLIGYPRRTMSHLTFCAVRPTKILSIPLPCMDKWMMLYKSWYHFVWQSFADRLDDLFETIDIIAFHTLDDRLVHYLQQQEAHLHSRIIPLTRSQIALELNSSREVVSRSLKKLSVKGKVNVHRHSIEIIRLD